MSAIDRGEVYSDEMALSIYDESVHLQRQVRSNVLRSAGFVTCGAVFFGLFVWAQSLQNNLPASQRNPALVMLPANGSLLTAAYSALLAVILAVWFTPNLFRVGASESPSTIARELLTRQVVALIARLCVPLSMGVAGWAFLSAMATTGPRQVDVVRVFVPVLLGLSFAYWAAAAEVRIGEVSNAKVVWAQRARSVERLSRIVEGDKSNPLSKRGRVFQGVIVFGGIPLLVWFVGTFVQSPPNPSAGVVRLITVGVVTVLAYLALRELTYHLVARQTWAAVIDVSMLLLVGVALWAAGVAAALPFAATEGALRLAPIARSMLLFTVLTWSAPFVVLALLTTRSSILGRQRGLVFDAVMKRYTSHLREAEKKLADSVDMSADAEVMSTRQVRKPFAWASVAALVPALPFNFMFAALALRVTEGRAASGRGLAIAAIAIGLLAAAIVLCALVYALLADPTLVDCDTNPLAICVR